MRILDRLKNAWNVLTRPAVYMDDDELKEWLGITGTNPDVEKEVTYYTCLKMLSETMGKALKQHEEPENKTLDIDAIADAVMEKIKAKEANQRNLEKEKIKAELLGDLDRYGV